MRGCGRTTSGDSPSCDSAFFPSNGSSYSRVCGRVTAIQVNTPDAFGFNKVANPGIESGYIDGVSLTHGAAYSRQHIWSFVAALGENFTSPKAICPCTRPQGWPFEVPQFIENNYFCASGNPGPAISFNTTYLNNPLWDGEGCGPTTTCCAFNNPPWFCTTLPQPTTDDLEVRICLDQPTSDEDILVTLIDIYAM